jgi:hypothetical protein
MLKSWANRKSGKEKHVDNEGRHSSSGSGNNATSGAGANAGCSSKIFGVPLPTDDLSSLSKGSYNPKHFIDGIPVVVYKTIRYLYKHGTDSSHLDIFL